MYSTLYPKFQTETIYQHCCAKIAILSHESMLIKHIYLPEVFILLLDLEYYQVVKSGKFCDEQFEFYLTEYEDIDAFEDFIQDFLKYSETQKSTVPIKFVTERQIKKYVVSTRFKKECIYDKPRYVDHCDLKLLVKYCPPLVLDDLEDIMTIIVKSLPTQDFELIMKYCGKSQKVRESLLRYGRYSYEQFLSLESILSLDAYADSKKYVKKEILPLKISRQTSLPVIQLDVLKYCQLFPELYQTEIYIKPHTKKDPMVRYLIEELSKFKKVICEHSYQYCIYSFKKSDCQKYWIISKTVTVDKEEFTKTSTVTGTMIFFTGLTTFECE
ncbi:hypothetical protein Catovirus_2_15 [Catovirus CTV1]|uniref:Uncharacterized protein n=1 Tax=Catovirus CTV1 TaxID=1977631 RepID=A0A1V0SBJ4_9VIRU|nr:hypothetical protein Catovirus_2_15 [Catovirus CTV1]